MTRVKNARIKIAHRNMGNSWGLEYPLIFGSILNLGACVWNRHTGEIVYVSQNANPIVAMRDAEIVSRQRNRIKNEWIDQDSVA